MATTSTNNNGSDNSSRPHMDSTKTSADHVAVNVIPTSNDENQAQVVVVHVPNYCERTKTECCKNNRTAAAVTIHAPPDNNNDDDGTNNKTKKKKKTGNSCSNQARRLLAECSYSFQGNGDRYDEQLLQRAVSDAGRWAYGTVLVEVWLMNESRTALYRPEAGWWIDPIYHSDCDLTNCQICRLTNRRRKDFVAPVPLAPGCGLPGALWQTSEEVLGNHHNHHHFRQHSSPSASSGFRQATAMRDLFRGVAGGGVGGGDGDNNGPAVAGTSLGGGVAWREVKALADDPDQPWNPRLQLLAGLGLGWAAAVPLRNPDPYADASTQGIVIFMAREGVDGRRLLNPSNESYLVSASNLIAAALAVRGPRHEAIRERRAEVDSAIRRVRSKILNTRLVGKTLTEVVRENEAKKKQQEQKQQRRPNDVATASSVTARFHRCGVAVIRRGTTTLKKMKGANVKPPPTFSWCQTLFTFFGVWITLLMLCFWSQVMTDEYGADYHLVLAPFGAMVTLLYGLTAAPASQPKNAIMGQLIAVSISLAFTYAENMHPHLRTSLATAIAVSIMVKFGFTHPPAGASAVFFSTGLLGWTNMAVLLIGNVLAIAVATVINNLSDRRQYPTYWGLGTIVQIFRPLDDEEVLKSSARRGFFRMPLRVAGPLKGGP